MKPNLAIHQFVVAVALAAVAGCWHDLPAQNQTPTTEQNTK